MVYLLGYIFMGLFLVGMNSKSLKDDGHGMLLVILFWPALVAIALGIAVAQFFTKGS